jgi:cyanophycinase
MTRRSGLALCSFVFFLLPWSSHADDKPAPGPVLAIGGGTLTDTICDRLVELCHERRLVVCPAASENVEGPEVERFRSRGAKDVLLADFRSKAEADDPKKAASFENVGGVFFTGGDQKRLLATLQGSKALESLRKAHEQGAVIAGTSAGCAVLGELSILGDGESDGIGKDKTPTGAGLDLCHGVVLDQHFLARRRHNRLVSVLLANEGKIGVGVDERTAALWRGSSFEVLGDSYVSVYVPAKKGRAFSLELLAAGERFELPASGSGH